MEAAGERWRHWEGEGNIGREMEAAGDRETLGERWRKMERGEIARGCERNIWGRGLRGTL